MTDLNKIRSLAPLELMKKELTDFLNTDRADMVAVYTEDLGWGEEDYDADLEHVNELLDKVEKRIKSLGNHLSKSKTPAKANADQPEPAEKAPAEACS